MSEKKNLGHNSKKDFLKSPVEHIDITSFDSRKIISSMKKMSFVSRETANASEIYNEMLKDKDCTIFLTLAKVRNIVQSLSFNISLYISDAFAVSLETKDIFFMEEIIFLESNEVISICSTGLLRKSFLLLWPRFFFSDIKQLIWLY